MEYKTREEYLHAAIELMRPWFSAIKYPLPEKIFISVGFAHTAKNALGVCYPPYDLHSTHIFIYPTINDDHQVLSTLAHELCHSVLPPHSGHGKEFAEVAGAIGLTPPWRSTGTSDLLLERIKEISSKLGKYPHEQLVPMEKPKKERTNNILKIKCPECSYEAKIHKKFIDEKGPPICPDHNRMAVIEEEEENSEDENE